MPSVLIVEDHELLAETLQVALVAEGISAELVDPTTSEDILAAVAGVQPTLVLLDLDLGPVAGDGTDLIEPMLASGSAVLIVTGTTDRTRVAAAIQAGAIGYLVKSVPFEQLLAVVRDALAGRAVLSDGERFELLAQLRQKRAVETAQLAPFDRLTPREKQVLRDLAEGLTVEAIAHQSVVSPATVRTQVRGILTKLDVGTQLAAVARARQSGWLDTRRR